MRPYLAILRDSVREAVSARTLPVLLIFFTVVLSALAPIGLEEATSWRLRPAEIADQVLFVAKLRHQIEQEEPTPGARILERLPQDVKQRIKLIDQEQDKPAPGLSLYIEFLAEAINEEVLPDPDFYAEAAWEGIPLPAEAEELLAQSSGRLSELKLNKLKRLNRLLLSAAFPASLREPPETTLGVFYLGYELPIPPMLDDPQIIRGMVERALYSICVWGVGPIGLLVAIIVTAEIMPRTFEPGTIDLLLSKPVSRALVFLTKFAGACMFVLVSFAYLVAGLWLIFGLRLGQWSAQLWGVVPLFLLTFAVIYSISAVVGMRYRSPIVAVFAAVLVWGASFLVGVTEDFMAQFREFDRVDRIVPLPKSVLVTTEGTSAYRWETESREWNSLPNLWGGAGERRGLRIGAKILGPVFDPERGLLMSAQVGAGGSRVLYVGSAESDWRTRPGVRLPPGTREIFLTPEGRLFAAGLGGLFAFHGDPSAHTEQFKLFGVVNLTPPDTENTFVRLEDLGGLWGAGMSVDLRRRGRRAVVYRQGRVTLLTRGGSDESFQKLAQRRLVPEEKAEEGLVGLAAERVIVVEKSGQVHLLEAESLETLRSLQPNGTSVPESVAISPKGTLAAVLFHDGDLWLYDFEAGSTITDLPAGQGDLTAARFGRDGALWVADRLRRVQTYSLPGMELRASREGSLETLEKVYRYGIVPLGYILPDTYGLRAVYEYLFTGETSHAMTRARASLESPHREPNLAAPLIHNALFLCVVLGLASIYVSRKDF